MQNTGERINFIADYLSNYESKIQLLNSCGLFDAAVHFELFAQEVCKLWFAGKQFLNLNIATYTYPCADLVSDDKSIFVQVSTTNNVSAKITKTLKSIQKSNKPDISSIKNIKVFVLNNSSVNGIKDKTVGSLTFTKQTDLITTKMVLEKAKTDSTFQTELYELFQRDAVLKTDFDNLKEAIEKSKFDISEIAHLINGEYEIDRSEQIDKIISDKAKNTAILGQAGYGKSVICKKIVEDKTNVLYARAERFIEESDINNIWGFNIKSILNVSSQAFLFFIDSLEFIADSYTKNNLLPYLFEITKNMPNVQIIVSCRTTDYNAFLKITSQYQIQTYEVAEVSEIELIPIAKKYPIIRKLNTSLVYAQLLKSPLYIDLIVSKITDFANINNENDFREYVWENIICLNDSNTKAIIKQIAFSRAKDFLLYVSSDEFDAAKIRELVSAGILLKKESLVRLKYDVFEDICFERYFDDEFNKCRGDYLKFFAAISTMGRCVYRRYQIWASNKLLCKENRNTIINKLVLSNNTPDEWKKETMVGLIRSRFSNCFFTENSDAIIKNGLLNKFIHLTNLYGFEINNSWMARQSQVIFLTPSGQGRCSLIEIVYNNDVYRTANQIDKGILKIISDYCKLSDNKNDTTTVCAVKILEYFLECDKKEILESGKNDLFMRHEYTISLLKPLYQLSEAAKEWIAAYWRQLDEWYKGDKECHAEEIIEFTLGFENSVLAYSLPDELCALAKMFWTYQRPKERDEYNFGMRSFSERHEKGWKFGLNEQAEQYESKHYRDTPVVSSFFHALFYRNFWKGLRWTVAFINEAVSHFQTNCPKKCFEWEIQFVDDGTTRNYLGDASMWLATIEEHHFPTVLSDLLFCLQDMVKQIIEGKYIKDIAAFVEKVGKYIYENSNNIALLAIISNIGIRFQKELPGYALDLATNIDIIHLDFQRKTRMMPNQMIEFLENQIMTTVGIPELKRRYMKKRETTDDLQQYVINAQIFGDKRIKEKCFKILDYLYSIVPNDAENATEHLQIQKMDLRTAKVERVDEKTVAISPSISGEAEKVVTRHGETLKPQAEVTYKLLALQKKYEADKSAVTLNDYIEAVELILEKRDNFQFPSTFDRELAAFISIVLELDKMLTEEQREKYCQILIDGAKGYLLNTRGYQFDIDFCISLFAQLQANISEHQKNEIKTIILESIISRSNSGLVMEMAATAKRYLKSNIEISTAVFNTVVKLAEDEMKHQKFNADYILKKKSDDDFFEFSPNITPKLRGVDVWINEAKTKKEKAEKYKSQRNKIIDTYLFKEKELKLEKFNTDDYDIELLCYALNCGLPIENDTVFEITKKTINAIINVWKANEHSHRSHDILDVYTLHEIEDFLGNQLIKDTVSSQRVIDALFDGVDFSKFTKDTIELYHNIFFALIPQYFDAYDNNMCRNFIVSVFQNIEGRIQAIAENGVKDELVKSLFFYFPQFKTYDWSKCKTKYSLDDKEFINTQLMKYGAKHLNDVLLTIRQLHIEELLPEVIIPLQRLFEEARKIDEAKFRITISEQKNRILLYISKAFIDFGDIIKQDYALTKAFESLLEILCEYNFEEAAVVLDEFRIH